MLFGYHLAAAAATTFSTKFSENCCFYCSFVLYPAVGSTEILQASPKVLGRVTEKLSPR